MSKKNKGTRRKQRSNTNVHLNSKKLPKENNIKEVKEENTDKEKALVAIEKENKNKLNQSKLNDKLINKEKLFNFLKFINKDTFNKIIRNKIFIPAVVIIALLTFGGIYIYNYTLISVKNAENFYYNADLNKAIYQYTKLYERKKTALMAAKTAEIYSVKGETENSRIFIQKAKETRNKNAEALYYIIFDELMNKDYKIALSDGEKALKEFPKEKNLYKLMFTVYMANNKIDEAKELVKKYPLDDKSAYDIAEYARMTLICGDWDKGLKELKRAWDIDKDEYKIYDVLAQISLFNKDDLLQRINKLSLENKEDFVYKMWMAKIYSLEESTASEANKILSELKDKKVGKIEIKLIEAAILQNSSKADKADELLKNIIKEKGNDYRLLHTAAWLYVHKKDYSKAEEYCKKSIEKNKDYPDNYGYLMPEILKGKNKLNLSEPYFRTAVLREPYNYNMILNAANYYMNNVKNLDKALNYFSLASMIKPDEPEIKYNIAMINITNKKEEEAIKILKECIKIKDYVPKYHRTLGTIYFLKGQNTEAIKEIRYAYNADKNDIMTLNNAGCYYISVEGDIQRGFYNLQKAYEGIDKNTDEHTKGIITENYKKAQSFNDKYKKAKNDESLTVPDFELFY